MVVKRREFYVAVGIKHRLRAKVYRRVEKPFDQAAKDIGSNQPRDLVAEFKLVENLLDVRREAVKIGLEIYFELLLACARLKVAQGEFGCIVECFPSSLA